MAESLATALELRPLHSLPAQVPAHSLGVTVSPVSGKGKLVPAANDFPGLWPEFWQGFCRDAGKHNAMFYGYTPVQIHVWFSGDLRRSWHLRKPAAHCLSMKTFDDLMGKETGTRSLIFRQWKLQRNTPKAKCQSCIRAKINFILVPHSPTQEETFNSALVTPGRVRLCDREEEEMPELQVARGASLPGVNTL